MAPCSSEFYHWAQGHFEIAFAIIDFKAHKSVDAEDRPFNDGTFDFLNISMGFHWLNQEKFLKEVKRVLRRGGYLAIDNHGFSGEISQDSKKQRAQRCFLEEHFPPASRQAGYPTQELIRLWSLDLVKELKYEHQISMSADEFVNFLITWSNFQVLSKEQKLMTGKKMEKVYAKIFEGQKLDLRFGGKVMLYRFETLNLDRILAIAVRQDSASLRTR